MDTKKIFMFLMLGIFMISMASALEFDNVKSYDAITRTVKITNAFGLGDVISTSMLESPLNVKVGVGEDELVGLFNYITSEEDVVGSFGDLYLEDLKTGKEISRGGQYKVYLSHEESVNDYKTICNSVLDTKIINNQTEICEQVEVGSHIEKVWEWMPITNKNIDLKPNTKYKIGIFVDVEFGDYGDWRPTFSGKAISEWATWEADIETGLQWYFDWEANSFADSSDSGNDGTNVGTSNASGKIGDGRNFDNDAITVNGVLNPTLTDELTMSMWINFDSVGTDQMPIGATLGARAYIQLTSGVLQTTLGSAGLTCSSGVSPSINTWYFVVITNNLTTTKIYINGDLENTCAGDVEFNTVDNFAYGLWNGMTGNTVFYGQGDGAGVWNRDISQEEVTFLWNSGDGLIFGDDGVVDVAPAFKLNSPTVDANYTTHQSLTFNFSASDDVQLSDVKLYVNDILNQTNATGINNTDYFFDLNLGDGEFEVYGIATDNNSLTNQSDSVNFIIDSRLPTITDASNITDLITFTLPINSTWNYNASDEHLDQCYYNSTTNATQTIITCNSTIITEWTTQGNKTITFCANDTFGLESCKTEYAYIYYIQETQADSPDPIAESFDATFNFTINLTNIPTTTATLILNNTHYEPTTTVAGSDGYYFEITVTIPEGWGNTTGVIQDWFWNYTIDGVATSTTTTTENITVYELAIDDCSSYGELIFNFSVLDEGNLVEANESLSIDVEADLTLTSKADASQYISYSNTWATDNNPQICVPIGLINNSQYWIDLTVGYSSTDHVWEFFYIDSGTLNSTKIYESFNGLTEQDVNLMDLLTADSTSFLFNYFDIDGLAVDGSIVHVMRKYIGSGKFLEVERAKQDQNGDTIVHLVEEDVIYYFLITKDGELLYTSSTYTALCQATPCTIQIEASGGSASFPTDWDLIDGGAYSLSSSLSTREVTLEYTFNESDTMNLTVYKYNSDGSYSVVDTNSSSGSSGSMVVGVPLVAGNVSFFASVTKGGEFKNSEWVDLEQKSRDSIGITLGLFLSALIILSLGLMTISEGAGTIFYVVLGVFISGALGLMATELSTGVSVTVYLIIAGAMLLWKFTRRRS